MPNLVCPPAINKVDAEIDSSVSIWGWDKVKHSVGGVYVGLRIKQAIAAAAARFNVEHKGEPLIVFGPEVTARGRYVGGDLYAPSRLDLVLER